MMSATTTLSIGEQTLLEHCMAINAENRAGLTRGAAREQDQRWGDVAGEPRGVDYVETEAAGIPAMSGSGRRPTRNACSPRRAPARLADTSMA
jgi:hypothetical protein